MELSKRLQAVADLVTPGNKLADVGTDHGYIPIYLVKKGIIPQALAMDVNSGPLERAREHIAAEKLEGKIRVRLSDGMKELQRGEADSVVIAGMGGMLTIRILETLETEQPDTWEQIVEFILQPQSEIRKVREFLADHGYRITEENMILEDGKYYPMMRAVHGTMMLDRLEALYGPVLLEKKHEVLASYLQWEHRVKCDILAQLPDTDAEGIRKRREEVQQHIAENKKAYGRIS